MGKTKQPHMVPPVKGQISSLAEVTEALYSAFASVVPQVGGVLQLLTREQVAEYLHVEHSTQTAVLIAALAHDVSFEYADAQRYGASLLPGVPAQSPQLQIEALRTRNSELTLENERLKSQRISESRLLLSAQSRGEYLEAQNEKQLEYIGELVKASRAIQAALIGKAQRTIIMHETHRGTATEVEGNEVAVTYETPDGPIEQIYHRSQFVHGDLPEEGDQLEAHVILTKRRPDPAEPATELNLAEIEDEFQAFDEGNDAGPVEI